MLTVFIAFSVGFILCLIGFETGVLRQDFSAGRRIKSSKYMKMIGTLGEVKKKTYYLPPTKETCRECSSAIAITKWGRKYCTGKTHKYWEIKGNKVVNKSACVSDPVRW